MIRIAPLSLAAACVAFGLMLSSPTFAEPTPQQVIDELDQLLTEAREDVTAFDRASDLWDGLSPALQARVRALEQAQAAADNPFLAQLQSDAAPGTVWAARTGQIMAGAAQAPRASEPPTTALDLDQQLESYQALQTRQAVVSLAYDAAQADLARFRTQLAHYRAGQPVDAGWSRDSGIPLLEFLQQGQIEALGALNELTYQYAELGGRIDALEQAIQGVAEDATAEVRFQLAFALSQAITQKTAEMLAGQLAFSEARDALSQRIATALTDGREHSAIRWQLDLQALAELQTAWVGVQQSVIETLVQQQDRRYRANAESGLGPADGGQLIRGLVERGVTTVPADSEAVDRVRGAVEQLVGGAQKSLVPDFTLADGLLQYAESFDEAVVAPNELLADPRGSIHGNLRFWRRYGAFWQGVGGAAYDGVVDLADLGIEAIDLNLEVHQTLFNYHLGTDIDWFGNENIEFISNTAAQLSADQVREVAAVLLRELDRRIAQNAARGETGTLNMLTDTGYAVGTVTGAEEGVFRAVVVVTRHGRFLVKGGKVEEFVRSAGLRPGAAGAIASAAPPSALPAPVIPDNPFHVPSAGVADDVADTLRDALPTELPELTPALINSSGWNDWGTVRRIEKDGVETLQIDVPGASWQLTGRPRSGSTSSVWVNPDNPNEVIKLTEGSAKGGLYADNYANRLLMHLRDSGALDSSKVHVLDIKRQVRLNDGRVLTVMERAPETVADLIRRSGPLSPELALVIREGLQELARNGVVLPDAKLDNLALMQVDGQTVLAVVDAGGGLVMGNAAEAQRFMAALYNPPPELLTRIEQMPLQHYLDELERVPVYRNAAGENVQASREVIEAAAELLAQAAPLQFGYFQPVRWGNAPAHRLADITYRWTRIREHKRWLAENFDAAARFDRFQQGTGLDVATFGPGERGVTYNPAGGRQSPELRQAFGGAPDTPVNDAFYNGAFGRPNVADESVSVSQPVKAAFGSSVSSGSDLYDPLPVFVSSDLPVEAPAGVWHHALAHVHADLLDEFTRPVEASGFLYRRLGVIAHRLANESALEPEAIVAVSAPMSMDELLSTLEGLPGVDLAEPDAPRTQQQPPTDHGWSALPRGQWGPAAIGLTPQARQAVADLRQDTVVAVVDTGVAWAHAELNALDLWVNPRETPDNGVDDDGNGYRDDIIGWNFIDGNNLPWDTDGHGTMVAGIVAARGTGGIGLSGVNPRARIMPLRALGDDGQGRASNVVEAVLYATRNGAQVINLSLGGPHLTEAESRAIAHAVDAGRVVVAAAGNEGWQLDNYGPAMAAGAIVVAASDPHADPIAASNWGDAVDLTAPGDAIVSLRARGTHMMRKYAPSGGTANQHIVGPRHAYYQASGTSFAAPFVAGAASLLLARHPELDPAGVRRLLKHTARDIAAPGRDPKTGYGLLDVGTLLTVSPDYYLEASIDGVVPVRRDGKPALAVMGTAAADRFGQAQVFLGSGPEPGRWTLQETIRQPATDTTLASIPARRLRDASVWTLRLLVTHASGHEREMRYAVHLE